MAVESAFASPEDLFQVIAKAMAAETMRARHGHRGDCILTSTPVRMDGMVMWAVLDVMNRRAYPVMMTDEQLRQVADLALEQAAELSNPWRSNTVDC